MADGGIKQNQRTVQLATKPPGHKASQRTSWSFESWWLRGRIYFYQTVMFVPSNFVSENPLKASL